MILQAYEYEKEQARDLGDFFSSTKNKFKHPWIKSLVAELQVMREKLPKPIHPPVKLEKLGK